MVEDNSRVDPIVSCVIILTANDLFVRNHLIPSILRCSAAHPIEILVVYNGTGGDLDGFRDVPIYRSRPFHVAAAYNRGARAAHGTYLALFHDDCLLEDERWIDRCLEALQGRVGAVSPELQIVRPLGPGQPPITIAKNVPLVLRRQLFYEVGGYDEYYFAGYEDLDFTYTLLREGWSIEHIDIASRHFNGMSTVILLGEDPLRYRQLFGDGLIPASEVARLRRQLLGGAMAETSTHALVAQDWLHFLAKFEDFLSEEAVDISAARARWIEPTGADQIDPLTADRTWLIEQTTERLGRAWERSAGRRTPQMTPQRRFHAYNVGIMKTGSHSMAGIFCRYRTAHEYMLEESIRTVTAYGEGSIGRAQLRDFVIRRDEQGNLEMDSAPFSWWYVDILVEAFPEARFILTMRDCYSWLDSMLNMGLFYSFGVSEWLVPYFQVGLGVGWVAGMARSREALLPHIPEFIDSCLAGWAKANTALLTALPPDRTLILRTHEISGKLDAIADFVGVPVGSLVAERSHLFKAPQQHQMLREVDGDWLQARVDHHCGPLMERYFPDCTLDAFLQRSETGAPPAASERTDRRQGRAGAEPEEDSTFAAYVELVRPDVSLELVSTQGMSAVVETARQFRGPVAPETFGLECDLSEPEPVADLSLAILSAGEGMALVRGLSPRVREHPVWRRVTSFLETWADRESALFSALENARLEFDLSAGQKGADASPATPLPSVFPGFGTAEAGRLKGLTTQRQVEATQQALELLLGRPLDPAVHDRLRACFELLPPGGEVFQVGSMLAQRTDAVRVCARGLELSEVVPYLERLAWGGERDRLEMLLDELAGRITYLYLNLDVARSVRPGLSLECYCETDSPAPMVGWEPLLEFLRHSEIALDVKCRALRAFPGYPGSLHSLLDADHWPLALRRASEFLGSRAISTFDRRLHHVMLTLEPGQPTQAKAHLSVQHRWIAPDGIS